MEQIRPLKKQFNGTGEVEGYKFTQIKAAKYAFLYEVDSGNGKHYEVFKKRVNRRYATITYPSAKAFGIYAWTCMSLDKAIEKFNDINIPTEKRVNN